MLVRRARHRQDAAGDGVRAAARTPAARSCSTGAATRRRCCPTSRSSRRCATTSAQRRRDARRPGAAHQRRAAADRARARRARAGLAEPLAGDPEGARSRLFEAVAALLCEAAQTRPLRARARRPALGGRGHAAAAEVRRALPARGAAHGRSARTARPTSSADHPLNGVLADLAREQLLERLALAPLDEARRLRARRLAHRQPRLARAAPDRLRGDRGQRVLRRRDPAPPGGVRRRATPERRAPGGCRCPRASATSSAAASRASARRRPASSRPPRCSAARSSSTCSSACATSARTSSSTLLERAIRAQIIEESESTIGRYAFSHALIRDALYGTLTRDAPRAAAPAGRERDRGVARRRPRAVPRRARQPLRPGRARPRTSTRRSTIGARAGERAVTLLAYEQAAAHYRQAIELLDRGGAGAGADCTSAAT